VRGGKEASLAGLACNMKDITYSSTHSHTDLLERFMAVLGSGIKAITHILTRCTSARQLGWAVPCCCQGRLCRLPPAAAPGLMTKMRP
jgi:hypothetical protein